MQRIMTRRGFLGSAALAMLAASVPPVASSQTTLKTRLDWKTFKKSRDYPSFMDAIRKMKANKTAGDVRSWAYWSQIHLNWCPHHDPYFLAWHRGYLSFLERELRAVSGNPHLTLPYWDYYQDPVIPAEFTDPAPWNPLYNGRVNTDVTQAMVIPADGVNPFASTTTTFQGSLAAFEQSLESRPHDPVHDLIGNTMASMVSPLDPIFWLHHANIDRLLNAWVAAGGGRILPPSSDTYWDGNLVDTDSRNWSGIFKYSDSTILPAKYSMTVRNTIDSRTNLGYFYDNEKLPSGAPAAAVIAARQLAALQPATPGGFASTGMRQTGPGRLALGGVRDVPLGRQSMHAEVGLPRAAVQQLHAVLDSYRASPFGLLTTGGQNYTKVKVVLADVSMTDPGVQGGYYYNLNLGLTDAQGKDKVYSFGNVGPFRVAGRQHHQHMQMGVEIDFDITDMLLRHGKPGLDRHSFTLDRVSGRNSPYGDVMHIGEIRLELA